MYYQLPESPQTLLAKLVHNAFLAIRRPPSPDQLDLAYNFFGPENPKVASLAEIFHDTYLAIPQDADYTILSNIVYQTGHSRVTDRWLNQALLTFNFSLPALKALIAGGDFRYKNINQHLTQISETHPVILNWLNTHLLKSFQISLGLLVPTIPALTTYLDTHPTSPYHEAISLYLNATQLPFSSQDFLNSTISLTKSLTTNPLKESISVALHTKQPLIDSPAQLTSFILSTPIYSDLAIDIWFANQELTLKEAESLAISTS